MELQQLSHPARGTGMPDAVDGATVTQTLEACRKLADAADAAIERAYSGNAELFIAANQQSGGQ